MADIFAAIEFLKEAAPSILRRFVVTRRGATYAEMRFEVVFNRSAAAEDGAPRDGAVTESAALGVKIYYGSRGAIGQGFSGVEIGRLALSRTKLAAALTRALNDAADRARADSHERAATIKLLGAQAAGLAALGAVPASTEHHDGPAVFRDDPRALIRGELQRACVDASAAICGLGSAVAFNVVAAQAELRHELFANSAGALISQGCAFAQGDCYVVAQTAEGHQETWDVIGQQRGFECLREGWRNEICPNPDLHTFATELAEETRQLAAAPALKPPDREVTVVTDPHFNALVAHEIIGHPCEADRALKMEAAYAGRSWLLRSLAQSELGRPVGSPLLWACSDPTLEGYGHYLFDHEGTPGRCKVHIEAGVFRGFLNSRATAAALQAEPNGSSRASEAWHMPLIRMSNTFFMPGASEPAAIIADVEHGYYVCGNQIPSIAESRENFRISARRVYEIENGRLGRLYRAGSVMSDSKRFFMNIDAVGNDLQLFAIPNCGKGQPMQVKRMSNGGPTIRSRAWLGGG